jgi:hypothetical protein
LNDGQVKFPASLAGIAAAVDFIFIAFVKGLAQAQEPCLGKVSGFNYRDIYDTLLLYSG